MRTALITAIIYSCGFIFAMLGITSPLSLKDREITILVIDGRNGKPMANERVLVFLGRTEEDLQQGGVDVELRTNKNGETFLANPKPEFSRLRIWVDRRTLCQPKPNQLSYSIDTIRETGISTLNDCSTFNREALRNELVVFARPATFSEKMRW